TALQAPGDTDPGSLDIRPGSCNSRFLLSSPQRNGHAFFGAGMARNCCKSPAFAPSSTRHGSVWSVLVCPALQVLSDTQEDFPLEHPIEDGPEHQQDSDAAHEWFHARAEEGEEVRAEM